MGQYKDRAFKVPMMHRWVIILPGRELVEEVRRLPKGVMSLREAGNQVRNFPTYRAGV